MSLRYTPLPQKVEQTNLKKSINLKNHQIRTTKSDHENLLLWMGDNLRSILKQVDQGIIDEMEEIRIRISCPLLLLVNDQEYFIDEKGKSVKPGNAYYVQREDILQAIERMTQSSLYAAEEEMKQGFLTLPGGHRVGITGEALMKDGELKTLKHISALNVRIAREIKGKAKKILPQLLREDGTLHHTLILSPPRAGKTTLLRDLIRTLSDGDLELGMKGQTVGVVDERGELAGMWQGKTTYYLGMRTDILDNCPKRIGISMLVRTMSPRIVAVDELGHHDDVEAVLDAIRTGVSVLSTAHAAQIEEAMSRPTLRSLFQNKVFQRVVILSRRQGPATIESIVDLEKERR